MAMFVCIFTEFDPIDAPKLNEKVLKDKRKKLRETFTRVYRLYVSILYVQIITVHLSNPSTSVGRLSPQLREGTSFHPGLRHTKVIMVLAAPCLARTRIVSV